MSLPILLVLAVLLFAAAYVTKRRFGVLGLGLTAGLVLSREVSREVAAFLQYVDMPVGGLPFSTAASVLLILAPALLMLISGPKYADHRLVLVGSVAFAVFAITLLMGPLASLLVQGDRSLQPLLTNVAENSSLIIAVGVGMAVLDTMYAHGKKPLGKKSKH